LAPPEEADWAAAAVAPSSVKAAAARQIRGFLIMWAPVNDAAVSTSDAVCEEL
jgi:hypothetical protein